MQVWRCLRRWSTKSLNNAAFLSRPRINQTLHQILHVLHVADFCSQMDWGQGCSAANILEVCRGDYDLWDYCTFEVEAANDAHIVCINTACGKEHSQKNLSKPILWYRNAHKQIASDVWKSNNSVHKLTADKPQSVLINVLITAVFEH